MGNCSTFVNWDGVSNVVKKLPRSLEEVRVKFSYGDKINAGKDRLCGKANIKALGYIVNPEKIHKALLWLIDHNPLYRTVTIDQAVLQSIRAAYAEPHVPSIQEALDEIDKAQTRYTTTLSSNPLTPNDIVEILRKDYGGARPNRPLETQPVDSVLIERGSEPCRPHEVSNLLGKIFPTLFPDGYSGDYRHYRRPLRTSEILAHTSKFGDPRFTKHIRYMFVMVNIKNMEAAFSSIATALKGRILKSKADGSTEDLTQEMFDQLMKVVC